MDHQRFDRLSRSLAMRTTRRQAVRQVGAGGVLGGVAAVLGVKALRAQDPVQTLRVADLRRGVCRPVAGNGL